MFFGVPVETINHITTLNCIGKHDITKKESRAPERINARAAFYCRNITKAQLISVKVKPYSTV